MRRSAGLLLLVVALGVAGVATLWATTKPDLEDARDTANRRWDVLRGPLTTRYDQVGVLVDALTQVGGPEREVTRALRESVARWRSMVANTRALHPDDEAASANELETLVARARTDVSGSARLDADPRIADALVHVALSVPSADDVKAYNRAARAYEHRRTRAFVSLVAGALGYESQPLLLLG